MDASLIVKLNAFLGIFTFCIAITLIIYLTKIKDVQIFKRVLPFAAGMVVVFLATVTVHIGLAVMNSDKKELNKSSQNQEQRNSSYIVTSEDHIVIDFSKSNCAEFGIILGDSPISDYTDGFTFSYLDLKTNELEKSPVEVTEVKADKKNGWHTVTVSAQKAGAYYLRISHKFALFCTDVLVVVTA